MTVASNAVVRTTHLTGITKDLGIGLVRMFNSKRRPICLIEEFRDNSMRIGLILLFIAGSTIGYSVFAQFQFRGLILPCSISGLLFFTAFYLQVVRRY
jgi:uncharacterized membrane protein YoaK (UPF0700 family)